MGNTQKSCVFCDIVHHNKEDYIVYEDDLYCVFLDTHPMKRWHLLVVPKQHIDYMRDLGDELLSWLMLVAKKLSHRLQEVTQCVRVWSALVWFDVGHAHLHLIPLFGSWEMFDPSQFYAASTDELQTMQSKLKIM